MVYMKLITPKNVFDHHVFVLSEGRGINELIPVIQVSMNNTGIRKDSIRSSIKRRKHYQAKKFEFLDLEMTSLKYTLSVTEYVPDALNGLPFVLAAQSACAVNRPMYQYTLKMYRALNPHQVALKEQLIHFNVPLTNPNYFSIQEEDALLSMHKAGLVDPTQSFENVTVYLYHEYGFKTRTNLRACTCKYFELINRHQVNLKKLITPEALDEITLIHQVEEKKQKNIFSRVISAFI